MCLVVPAQVIAIEGATATVDVAGRPRIVMTPIEPAIVVGDWVVVAAGTVLRRLEPAAATAMRDAVKVASSPPPHDAFGRSPS